MPKTPVIKTLCFMLECTNTVLRKPDDFINVYCEKHNTFNFSLLEDYKPQYDPKRHDKKR